MKKIIFELIELIKKCLDPTDTLSFEILDELSTHLDL